jgi:hypothetical protein
MSLIWRGGVERLRPGKVRSSEMMWKDIDGYIDGHGELVRGQEEIVDQNSWCDDGLSSWESYSLKPETGRLGDAIFQPGIPELCLLERL